ncbi:RluA family pseudouridine synthase [Pustulibacterium marinum]|nr:RluA family pseudouridine synthase [Pustulibacterium marinum]
MSKIQPTHFHTFQEDISQISLPNEFTFPFYYSPHPLSVLASNQVQKYLENQTDFEHNFGLNATQKGLVIGKMFGVLVVENAENEIGFLAAFSGKLADENLHSYFVPPVFDMLQKDGFFKQEEEIVNALNSDLEAIENSSAYLEAKSEVAKLEIEATEDISKQKKRIKTLKKERDHKRKEAKLSLNETEFQKFNLQLDEESRQEKILLKKMETYWRLTLKTVREKLTVFDNEILRIKQERKEKSAALQQRLFDKYTFLNANGNTKSVGEIFDNNPPAAAGECAAPKLLQYAYQHNLKPIAMAEFWWGASPKSEVRKHQQFYPSCRSKCEPILGHMLEGIQVAKNPIQEAVKTAPLEIIFEDEYMLAVNKPEEMLSVPGKTIKESVYTFIKERYPEATGPLIVHRLDMSTSGIMLLAKNESVYKNLQSQFIKRSIKKRYVALLNGKITQEKGIIELPLRVDLDNRPMQLVCYEHGKPAKTKFKVVSKTENQTRIHFFPITGRTHQLRVHSAHVNGLNCAIVGDDLYGTKANRLHLHAEEITFQHPVSREEITLIQKAPF